MEFAQLWWKGQQQLELADGMGTQVTTHQLLALHQCEKNFGGLSSDVPSGPFPKWNGLSATNQHRTSVPQVQQPWKLLSTFR